MQNISNNINVLSESKVYDYVAGNMNDQSRQDFEKELSNDHTLREAVEIEKLLRLTLLDFDDSQIESCAENQGDFDALFDVLNDDADDDSNISQFDKGLKPNWYAGVGIAASVVFAMVLFINYEGSDTNNFTLLSDDVNSKKNDFNSLIKQQKVAQIWLDNDFPSEQFSALFSKYELKPIGRAGNAWIVASTRPLLTERLEKLRLVEGFKKISLISYNAQTTVVD